MNTIRLHFLDDEAHALDEAIFGTSCAKSTEVISCDSTSLFVQSSSDPDLFLSDLLRCKHNADALLLDIDFSNLNKDELTFTDPSNLSKQQWGFDILRTVKRIDPDFPVVMFTALAGQVSSFDAGRFGADDFMNKAEFISAGNSDVVRKNLLQLLLARLRNAIAICSERTIYDHEHLATADQFAQNYDQVERSSCATVAYYHYENEMILKTITNLLDTCPSERRLRILDIGCGTGRVQELLARHNQRGRLEVVCVDFSGGMLRCLQNKLEKMNDSCLFSFGSNCHSIDEEKLHLSLFRAPAEHLVFLSERYPDGFDLAIMGFGFLSYVKYSDILPASPNKPAENGIFPLVKGGGKLILSVYNEDSAIYSRVATLEYPDSEIPIAALMDLAEGRLRVGDRYFNCEAFTIKRIMRFLRQAGFSVSGENISTFPTLHLTMCNSLALNFPDDPDFPSGKFNPDLYNLDKDLSRVLSGKGHYIVGIAEKPIL